MRIAISSDGFRTVAGHAGRAQQFIVYEVGGDAAIAETARLELPAGMPDYCREETHPHPIDDADILITGGCCEDFAHRMARRGVRVVATSERDPEVAVHAYLAGCLKPARS